VYIGICDDNNKDLSRLRNIISNTLFDVEDISIVSYTNGKDIIWDIEKGTFKCELLYLDIFMDPVDGMKVAEYIRGNDVDVDIIFVTNSVEHVYEGYLYKAFAYILKDSMDSKLPDITLRYMKEISTAEEYLNITSEGAVKRIPISRILYIESDARKLLLHLKNDVVSFYGKLSEMEEMLDNKGFMRIHQSYMVKENAVTKYTKTSVYIGDLVLPVSRKYASKL